MENNIEITEKGVIFAKGTEKNIISRDGKQQKIIPVCFVSTDYFNEFGCGVQLVDNGKIIHWGWAIPKNILASYRGMLLIQETLDEDWYKGYGKAFAEIWQAFQACYVAGDRHDISEVISIYDKKRIKTIETKLGIVFGKKWYQFYRRYRSIGRKKKLEIIKQVPSNLIEIIKVLDHESISIAMSELLREIERGTLSEQQKEFIYWFKHEKRKEVKGHERKGHER